MTGTDAVRGGLPIATGRQTARAVWRLSRGHRAVFLLVAVLGLVSTGIDLLPPVVIGVLVDRVGEGTADLLLVLAAAGVMAAAAVIGAIGTALTIVLAARSYHAMLAELREDLVARAMALPQHVVETAGTGDLVSRSSDDVTAVADAAPAVIPVFTVTTFTIVAALAALASLEWPYAAAFLVVLPVYIVALRWYLRVGPAIYRSERTAMSGRAQHIIESQRGYETILGLGLGRERHRSVLAASWAVARPALRARTVQNMFFARLSLAEYLGLAAVLVTGFVLIQSGHSSVGGATAAMLLVLRLFGPVGELLFVIDTLQSALASLNRMVGVAGIPAQAGEQPTGRWADPAAGAAVAVTPPSGEIVSLREVSFGYGDGGASALQDITLRIGAGERVAVVGSSGAGKTTLASVIAGIHPPRAGIVLRPERTAVIAQESHVFAGTLRENLTLASADSDDDAVRASLHRVGASALEELLPQGLDTPVGGTGHQLTPAQAQQIALARVVLDDPELAILDEATAEAGSTHADLLDGAADAALAGRTGLVIAHRLSQAAACDRIIVLEGGRIVEQGRHDDLVGAGGVYARLWAAWVAHS